MKAFEEKNWRVDNPSYFMTNKENSPKHIGLIRLIEIDFMDV
jgi:hypothetical protein